MTEKELKAIEARCEAATEGPWKVGTYGGVFQDNGKETSAITLMYYKTGGTRDPGGVNTEFIAHARTDIPALIKAIRDRDEKIKLLESICEDNDESPEY